MIRVVDNKRIDMTDDEWSMYEKIVKSYTNLTNRGEDLFMDLFETDNNGIIIFLKPPSKRFTSLEVFLFLMSLQSAQHIRCMYSQVADICQQMKNKMQELENKINDSKK